MAAADPDSASYGRWLSNEAVHELVAPSAECKRVVADFLAQHGVAGARDATPNGDFVSADVSVATAERLLGAEYHAFEHLPSGHVAHRTPAYRPGLTDVSKMGCVVVVCVCAGGDKGVPCRLSLVQNKHRRCQAFHGFGKLDRGFRGELDRVHRGKLDRGFPAHHHPAECLLLAIARVELLVPRAAYCPREFTIGA